MRILVQGPGAIGRLMALRLAAGKESVTLLARRQPGSSTRTKIEYELEDESGRTFSQAIDVVQPGEGLPDERYDLLLVAVKAFDVAAAVAEGVRHLEEDGRVLVLSNGLGHVESACRCWPEERVVMGTIVCGAIREGEHRVRCAGTGPIRIGAVAMGSTRDTVGEIGALFRRARFEVDEVVDVEATIWQKVAVNCAINPVASLLRCTNGELLDSPAFEGAVEAAKEVTRVARAADVDVPTDGWRDRVADVCERTRSNRCSMLEDLSVGRRTEIDSLCGAVVTLAAERQEEVPINRVLHEMISDLEAKPELFER